VVFIKVIGILIIDVDKESSKSKMEIIIKVNGGKIKGRDRDYKGIIMVMFIEVGQWKND